MKRDDFKKIIKIFSFWRIDKRKGDYRLPNGKYLSDYLKKLAAKLLEQNQLAIRADGNIGEIVGEKIFIPFGENEDILPEQQEKAIKNLIKEMLY